MEVGKLQRAGHDGEPRFPMVPHGTAWRRRGTLLHNHGGRHSRSCITSSTFGLTLFLLAGSAYLILMQRLSRYRAATSRPWWLETWTKGLMPSTYTDEGHHLLKRLQPWIVAIFILEIVGIVIFVARS